MDGLTLDIDTILAINERLRTLADQGQPLEALHGRISLEIVKGRFQRLEVTGSYLLNDNKQKRQRSA